MTIGRYVSCLVGLVPLVGAAAAAAAALLASLVSSCNTATHQAPEYLSRSLHINELLLFIFV